MAQVTLDLGPVAVSEDELQAVLARLEPTWEAKDYHVFDKNCVHFADALAKEILPDGRVVPQPLLQARPRPISRDFQIETPRDRQIRRDLD